MSQLLRGSPLHYAEAQLSTPPRRAVPEGHRPLSSNLWLRCALHTATHKHEGLHVAVQQQSDHRNGPTTPNQPSRRPHPAAPHLHEGLHIAVQQEGVGLEEEDALHAVGRQAAPEVMRLEQLVQGGDVNLHRVQLVVLRQRRGKEGQRERQATRFRATSPVQLMVLRQGRGRREGGRWTGSVKERQVGSGRGCPPRRAGGEGSHLWEHWAGSREDARIPPGCVATVEGHGTEGHCALQPGQDASSSTDARTRHAPRRHGTDSGPPTLTPLVPCSAFFTNAALERPCTTYSAHSGPRWNIVFFTAYSNAAGVDCSRGRERELACTGEVRLDCSQGGI